jgi:SMI1/KNR4 family protein SUKH-1
MFEYVTVVGGPLILSGADEVDAAEAKLGVRFPSGYREFVTQLGEGVLGGSFVRIYPPHRILAGSNNVHDWRQRIKDHWFWNEGKAVLTKQMALESIIIGDTVGGDELVVHPNNAERVLVLPHDAETIYVGGDGLLAVIEWLCSSGTLTDAFDERNFEPFDSRRGI